MKRDDAKFLDLGGTKTRYFDKGHGEPLVLIHGGSYGFYATSMDWDTVFDSLSKSFRAIAFDKLGQGYTDNPKKDSDYRIAGTYNHTNDLVNALNLKNIHIVGHSRGAYPAARLAMERPDLVKSLIIVDSGTMMWTHNNWYHEVDERADKINNVPEKLKYILGANCFTKGHISGEWLEDVKEVYSLPKCQEAFAKHASIFSDFEDDLGKWQQQFHGDIRNRKLKKPVLIVWGYNDPSSPMHTVGQNVMKLFFSNLPHTQMKIINRAGHYCYRDQPDIFVKSLTEFIRSL